MNGFNILYVRTDIRLFINSSKRRLKVVLLHNGNVFASIPVGYSVHLKERYENLEFILDKINYEDHKCVTSLLSPWLPDASVSQGSVGVGE